MYDNCEARRIIRRVEPELSETPVFGIHGLLTDTDRFYVRNHFPVPAVDPDNWRLVIYEPVGTAHELTLTDLEALPQHAHTAVLECAGNGGIGGHLVHGAFGIARWQGPSVRDVLDRAGVRPTGTFVTVRGTDRGRDPDEHPGIDHYERSVPLDVLLDRGLLATRMNDVPLPPEHGFPVRLVIPGWYGADWVKWIESMTVTNRPSQSIYMTRRYRMYQDAAGDSYGPLVRTVAVTSVVCSPAQHRVVTGPDVAVSGLAWTGEGRVASVAARVADGSWQSMSIDERTPDGSVVRWSGVLSGIAPGVCVVESRATDSACRTQPELPHGRMYEANHVTGAVVYCRAAVTGERLPSSKVT